MRLKGGFVTQDPRLDRLPQFDERSRAFRAVEGLEGHARRSYSWNKMVWLDQGREGACVGFSLAHELAARPVVVSVDEAFARNVYHQAQRIDEWPGEDYSGTSVIAGTKVLYDRGYFSEYRWAFGEEDLALAVGYRGPAVLGINWYSGMWNTDADGYIQPSGHVVGGHAILCASYSIKRAAYRLDNSWGPSWGVNGSAWIKAPDLARLLHEDGEAMVPVVRKHPPPLRALEGGS